jgi:hypothetical protein
MSARNALHFVSQGATAVTSSNDFLAMLEAQLSLTSLAVELASPGFDLVGFPDQLRSMASNDATMAQIQSLFPAIGSAASSVLSRMQFLGQQPKERLPLPEASGSKLFSHLTEALPDLYKIIADRLLRAISGMSGVFRRLPPVMRLPGVKIFSRGDRGNFEERLCGVFPPLTVDQASILPSFTVSRLYPVPQPSSLNPLIPGCRPGNRCPGSLLLPHPTTQPCSQRRAG